MIDAGTSRGAVGLSSAATTVSVSPAQNVPIGSLLAAYVVSDNITTTDGDTTDHTIEDNSSGSFVSTGWTRLKERTESSGVTLDGITVSIWLKKLTSQLDTGDSVRLTTSQSDKKAIRIVEFPITAGHTFSVIGTPQTTQGNGSTPAGLQMTSLDDVQRLHLACTGVESSSTAVNDDTDFAGFGDISSSGGGSGANCRVRSFADLKGGTSSDTYNPTLTATVDYVAILCAVEDVAEGGDPAEGIVMRAEEGTGTDATSYATQAVRINGDCAILSVYNGIAAGDANEPTPSGLGATWTVLDTQQGADGPRRLTTWKGTGVTGPGAVTIDCGGQTQAWLGYVLSDAFDVDPSSLEVQQDSDILGAPATSIAQTLASFADPTNNLIYQACVHGGNTPNTTTFELANKIADRAIGAESITGAAAWAEGENTSPDISWTNSGHGIAHVFEFARASTAQNLAGSTFTRAPTFPTGTVAAGAVNLAGSVFTKTPTFPAGAITSVRNLAGATFQRAPTFPTGAVAPGLVNLAGVLFQRAPTFPQGTVAGVGGGQQDLTGTTFTSAPTFPTGAVAPGAVNLAGIVFQKAPVFGAGTLTQEGGPQPLGGTTFTKTPTFPTGVVGRGAVNLAGATFQRSPTFFAGQLGWVIHGTTFQRAPSFPTGALAPGVVDLAGTTFLRAPTFGGGTIGAAGALSGTTFVRAGIFFQGTVAHVIQYPEWLGSAGDEWLMAVGP